MNEIGGYFGLELGQLRPEFHEREVIRLNTARNAFEYLLLANKYSKVFIPYFTCDVMLEPLLKHSIMHEFYSIDNHLEPVFDFDKLTQGSVFLYTNYFGLKNDFIFQLEKVCDFLIIDNAQSFYSKPINGIDTFYSPRKFFGVPDGSYLYSKIKLPYDFEQDYSIKRFEHLLIRIDKNAEEGYGTFLSNDENLGNMPIMKMSHLSRRLLQSIDYEYVKIKRQENYSFFEEHLSSINKLKIKMDKNHVPLIYPFWTSDFGLKKKLLENKIYCASYWPNVLKWSQPESLEYQMAKEIIHLPIDQRYNLTDLIKILKIITNEY